MSLTNQYSQVAAIGAAVFIMAAFWAAPVAATPVLDVRISDTLVTTESSSVWMDVFLTNTADSVAGFSMVIVLDMPGPVEFMTAVGSPVIDTAGCLISGWRLVTANFWGGNPTAIKVVGLANSFSQPKIPSIAPRTDPSVLFRMEMKINPYIPGTLPDRTVHLMIIDMLSMTAFADENGNLIGVTTIVDTTFHYWQCLQWDGDNCLSWMEIPTPEGADSTSIEIGQSAVLDTSLTHYQDGTVRAVPLCHGVCGDANDDGQVSVADAVFIISYVFRGGSWPFDDKCADPNNDYMINVGDAVFLINYIFRSGAAPNCTPH